MISRKKGLFLFCIISTSLFISLNRYVDLDLGGHFEGFYLLREKASGKYEIADHLFVGREKQIVYAVDLTNKYYKLVRTALPKHSENYNHLHCDWNPRDGSGMVSNYF